MATNKILKELYNGEVKIDFFPDSHRYKISGEKSYLTSVTACTGIIDKSRVLIDWAIKLAGTHLRQYLENAKSNQFSSEELLPVIEEALKQHTIKKETAAGFGGTVHDFAEKFAKYKLGLGELPEIKIDWPSEVTQGVNAFLSFFNANNVKFLEVERLVYSKEFGFCGIFDVLAEVNGELCLIDYKTSKSGHFPEYKAQIAAYKCAYTEETGVAIKKLIILHFSKDTGEFEIIDTTNSYEKDLKSFIACLTVKKWLKEIDK